MKPLLVATILAVVLLPSALVVARGKAPSTVPNVLIYNPNGEGL